MADDWMKDLRIATPCSESWERMDGDERARHCAVCNLNVYNFAGMTRDEVKALLARNEGRRVCGRLYRRADGTVLTRDCPTGLRELRRRASRMAAAAIAALLSLPAFAARLTTHGSNVKLTLEHPAAPQPAAFTGVVVLGGDPVPGVTVTLRDETSTRTVIAVTDVKGVFTFASLTDGLYRVDLALPGLEPASIEHLQLKSGVVTHANIAMQPIELMGVILIPDEPVKHDALSTTFSQSFIDKLPR